MQEQKYTASCNTSAGQETKTSEYKSKMDFMVDFGKTQHML